MKGLQDAFSFLLQLYTIIQWSIVLIIHNSEGFMKSKLIRSLSII